jgi:quercetin dioxygenase-like cupin family protein
MMQIFDLHAMTAHPYAERAKNVFYQVEEFKTRIIELPSGGAMPACEMASHVIFYVLAGSADVTVNQEQVTLQEGACLIAEPATFTMRTTTGVKILGVQIMPGGEGRN